ncbi:Endoplasmic reticulum-based factor for assembly of V-ATPase [Nesidiocoris tenuis]|uniref:Biogenesis of lysosome-related organelles complex 1 subunit 5 n=1 Tax=Nesidiocoris tenuis TaxID=355587 RepID=A0ABN7AN73_9HEMI|nr:Endoplasmic reticulum-based factor for assembly of V-ATPase [Nesidiocoris tenuis]
MSSAVFKACSDIWFRLFDHRPFLSGEIKQFVKDFEESRGDQEVARLFDALEWATDVRDSQVDHALGSLPNLEKINTLLDIANQNCNTVLEHEQDYSVDRALEAKRAARKSEWEKFSFEVDQKYTKIEETFRSKELELTEFYRDLESKLHKSFESALKGSKKSDDVPPSLRQCVKSGSVGIDEIKWLHSNKNKDGPWLHELLSTAELELPQPYVPPRNPVLEARCQRLRAQIAEQEYKKMTKNVDNSRVHHPEDTIQYQLNIINRQLIAVFQFVVSVATGFTFGFYGIQLMTGDLDFGFRLLLGVICSLIIALAEIYFLAKKLAEDMDFPDMPKSKVD